MNDTDPTCPHDSGLAGWCAHCDDFDAPVSYVPRADGDELFPLAADDDSAQPTPGGLAIASLIVLAGVLAGLAALIWGPQP